ARPHSAPASAWTCSGRGPRAHWGHPSLLIRNSYGPRPLLPGSVRAPPGLLQLAVDGPGVGDRADVAELVGIDDGADGLDLPVEHIEGQRLEHLAVPVAEDRAGLAVHFVRLARHVDP